jgi:hypothetical protein
LKPAKNNNHTGDNISPANRLDTNPVVKFGDSLDAADKDSEFQLDERSLISVEGEGHGMGKERSASTVFSGSDNDSS